MWGLSRPGIEFLSNRAAQASAFRKETLKKESLKGGKGLLKDVSPGSFGRAPGTQLEG